MYNENYVSLIGNLGSAPEMRYTPVKGTPVVNFTLATNERWKDESGKQQERVEWHRIQCWGKLAELVSKYLDKGSYVRVKGKLATRKWDDKEGVTRYVTEIKAQNIGFLDCRDRAGAGDDLGDEGVSETSPPPADGDIPF